MTYGEMEEIAAFIFALAAELEALAAEALA